LLQVSQLNFDIPILLLNSKNEVLV